MRLSPGIPDLDGLVAFLRASRCIAYVLEDGSVEVIPPPEADPADDWVVIGLVRSWQDEQGITIPS
jgi:hypothetical protein